jgi:hypothetical protein
LCIIAGALIVVPALRSIAPVVPIDAEPVIAPAIVLVVPVIVHGAYIVFAAVLTGSIDATIRFAVTITGTANRRAITWLVKHIGCLLGISGTVWIGILVHIYHIT